MLDDPVLWLLERKWLPKVLAHLISTILVAVVLFGGLYLLGAFVPAEPVAASGGSDNACTEIGTAGPRTIYYCVNPQNGQELYVNDAGFIEVVE